MTDGAVLLADEVLPAKPIRQWVLSLPFLLATDPKALTQVLGIVYRTISWHVLCCVRRGVRWPRWRAATRCEAGW
jgi:hypothetical protein